MTGGEEVVLELLAAFGIGWAVAAILGGYRMFHAMRHEFSRTLLPLFVASFLSSVMLFIVSLMLYPYVGLFQTLFFVFEAVMVSWLFRDYIGSIARILPAIVLAVALAWVGAIAVALALYFCVFALLVLVSSIDTIDKGSPIVFAADILLIASFSLQLYYTVFGHFFYFFIGAVAYTLATGLLITPAVVVEVVRRHAPQQE
jgi:membrane-associated HD superfamily phosphohydrolase